MDTAALAGVSRAVIAGTVPYLVHKGIIPAGDADWIVDGVTVAIVGVWSWWSKRPKED